MCVCAAMACHSHHIHTRTARRIQTHTLDVRQRCAVAATVHTILCNQSWRICNNYAAHERMCTCVCVCEAINATRSCTGYDQRQRTADIMLILKHRRGECYSKTENHRFQMGEKIMSYAKDDGVLVHKPFYSHYAQTAATVLVYRITQNQI